MATSLEKALQKAIEAPDIVVGLRAFGLTQNDIATVTKVTPRAIRGWKAANPRPEPYDRLAELQSLVVLLSDSLTPRWGGPVASRSQSPPRRRAPHRAPWSR